MNGEEDAAIKALRNKKLKTECGNYRGLSFVAHAGQTLPNVITSRFRDYANRKVSYRRTVCLFRPHRSTAGMMFVAVNDTPVYTVCCDAPPTIATAVLFPSVLSTSPKPMSPSIEPSDGLSQLALACHRECCRNPSILRWHESMSIRAAGRRWVLGYV